ncbi:cardiolipin synthase [Nocardioides insulae]|uniref:cardiolipin synthase n=1 Tax=Nocardioides insulae TaxID=394734 RepID=UPI00040FD601|nr:cardiolipin synthase [Nocardioides insulae]
MSIVAVSGALLYVLDLAIKVLALGLVPKNRRPSSGMAWLLVIMLVPVIGIIVFWMLGLTRLDRKRHERQRVLNDRVMANTQDLIAREEVGGALPPDAPAYLPSLVALNENLGGLPVVAGNRIDFFGDYSGSIDAMAAEIGRATTFVHVEFYITACDRVTEGFFDALDAAVARGVTVRLLLDHVGSRGIPGYDKLVERLDASGIQWRPMLPIRPLKGEFRRPDLRNHRKILVVDGLSAFTGSQNLIEPGYNKPKNHKAGREWVELTCRVEGPLVNELDVVFATDWNTETGETLIDELAVIAPRAGDVAGQIIPSGPGVVAENNLRAFTTLIYGARHRISLTSPYFVPDESLLYAVTTAAQRGVEVELFVSEEKDQFMVFHAQRSYYEALLRAGVRIHLYPRPAVLHSKHMSIDDDVALLGSSNMDMRSFALNYEVSTLLFGGDVVARMRAVEDRYRELSRELTLEDWLGRSRGAAYVDNVMRLTSALQ